MPSEKPFHGFHGEGRSTGSTGNTKSPATSAVTDAAVPCAVDAIRPVTASHIRRTARHSPARLCRSGERYKVYCQGSCFPETPTTSLGVLQPWPLPSSRLVSPEIGPP